MSQPSARTIVYDGRNLMLEAGTGIATYTRHLARAARDLGFATEALVASEAPVRPKDHALTQIELFDALAKSGPGLRHRIMLEARWLMGAPFGVDATAIDVIPGLVETGADRLQGFDRIHAADRIFDIARYQLVRRGRELDVRLKTEPSLFHATHATPIRVRGCPNVYTIHDIVPLRVPHATLENKGFFLNTVRRLCKTAEHIVTVSEFSRRDIIELTAMPEDRITNTYQAVELPPHMLARPEADVANDLERIYGLGYGDYFLFVGAIEPKKNLTRLIEAYASSGTKRPLVIAGGLGWQYQDVIKAIRNERFLRFAIDGNEVSIKRKVRRLDYVPLSRLVSLFRGARAMLFPSIYEGFGLPVIEAMQAGAPVMTSNSTSLKEIAADAALLVDPYDIDAMALAIRRLDDDGDLRAELSARGLERAKVFTPAAVKARIASVYDRVLSA